MNSLTVIDLGRDTIYILLKISLPILLTALFVGLIVSIFQALTQIQEPTLSFVPKIIAIFIMLLLTLGYIGYNLQSYTEEIMALIANPNQ